MDSYLEEIDILYTGCANGADAMARDYAADKNIPLRVFSADWDKHGIAAGPIRNRAMLWAALDEGAPYVVAFAGGKGTRNCCITAEELKIPIYKYDDRAPAA
jgi:hypothetical protein